MELSVMWLKVSMIHFILCDSATHITPDFGVVSYAVCQVHNLSINITDF